MSPLNKTEAKPIQNETRVTVSNDKMEAFLFLASPSNEEDYTYDGLLMLLSQNKIVAGIHEENIKKIVKGKRYQTTVSVAKGVAPVNGEKGYYQFHFRTALDNKPKILEDGSVDYRSRDSYEAVQVGDLLANYIPATPGTPGVNVFGASLPAKPGQNLTPLKGKGFVLAQDNNTYYAAISGKVELSGDNLNVTDILEITEDVDYSTGNISFSGDVYIRGNVLQGTMIQAGKSITVCGNVESASLVARENIELKSGMQGGGRGRIECGGDLWGKFFEQSKIRVKGSMHANSMMNCDTEVEGEIYISGRHGIIVGGNTVCMNRISATVIGNMAEIQTVLTAGVTEEFSHDLGDIDIVVQSLTERISKIESAIQKLEMIKNPADLAKLAPKKILAIRGKRELEAVLEENLRKRQVMLSSAGTASAQISVAKYLYPGVTVCINGATLKTKYTYTNVIVKNINGKIEIVNNR